MTNQIISRPQYGEDCKSKKVLRAQATETVDHIVLKLSVSYLYDTSDVFIVLFTFMGYYVIIENRRSFCS